LKVLLVSNTSWYLYNFRLPLANVLRERGIEVVLVSPDDQYTKKLVDQGFNHINLKMRRNWVNPISDLRIFGQLFRIYRHEKPNLAHHFTSKCVLYGSLAAKMAGILKVVNSITGMGYVFSGNGWSQRLLKPLVLSMYKICLKETQVIFQNKDDEKEFKQIGILGENNFHIIRSSGVDLDRFHPSIKNNGIPIIILAARMLRDKGVFEFVEAARILKERGINSRMVLVGEPDPGNPSSIPVEQLKTWSESNMIEWWGWKDDMVSVFSEADIVCLPSYREGLPKSLIEAAASSLPIVTTETNGCRDVVSDGINGYLVPVRDSSKLADALQKLIQNPELRQKMGVLSRKMAERDFDLRSVIQATLDVYGLRTTQ
jgi:glycosyltransferase involved in cell wall biosynthesis